MGLFYSYSERVFNVRVKKRNVIIIGMDEAGRGPWAGPVVTACVLLPAKFDTSLLNDSKKMTSRQREKSYTVIMQKCIYGIGIVDNVMIDQIGIKKATERAMQEALNNLFLPLEGGGEAGVKKPIKTIKNKELSLLVDGNDRFSFSIPHQSIIKGDEKVPAISAASIVAKVWRDKLMDLYDEVYPLYAFREHKGYGTAKHMAALKKYGPCPLHRFSYKPVKALIKK